MNTLFGISLESLRARYGISMIEDPTTKKLHSTERSTLLEEIRTEVNREREKTKFYVKNDKRVLLKAMTGAEIGVKLAHIPTGDLYYLKSICLDFKNRNGSFSKCLFGSIKPKHEEKPCQN